MTTIENEDPRHLGIGNLMDAHLEQYEQKAREEMRDVYSIAGKALNTIAKTREDRQKGAFKRAKNLADESAIFREKVSTVYIEIKAKDGTKPPWKLFIETMADRYPEVHWEKHDVNGWWKKLNKGERVF